MFTACVSQFHACSAFLAVLTKCCERLILDCELSKQLRIILVKTLACTTKSHVRNVIQISISRFLKTNTDRPHVYQQKTFIDPIRWLKTISKLSQCLGYAHACTCWQSSLFRFFFFLFPSSSSSLAVACLTRGYELHCLLSGLGQGCVWAWLRYRSLAVRDLHSLGAAEWRNMQQFTAS